MFQYGPREALLFLVVLLPLAAALAGAADGGGDPLHAPSRKRRRARRSSCWWSSLLPLVNLFELGGEAPWHLWVPALAQNTLMTRVLKGEDLGLDRRC